MSGRVIVITGPTATGKTALGARLALELGSEVISADSMQIYEHMDIGTAKPTEEEMLGVPHHMIGCVSPFESYSVSRYVEDGSRIADELIARGKIPVIVGGTGLYIDSLIAGTAFAAQGSGKEREALNREYDEAGGEAMLQRLRQVDPASADKLHPSDRRRIVRALEIHALTGMAKSALDEATRTVPPRYDAVKIALSFADRADLYERIDRRVDGMMACGLLEEVRSLLDMGLSEEHTAMQAIGYKELSAALRGECTVQEAVDAVKRGSRRYAKRQLSWLRRDETLNWLLWAKTPDIPAGLLFSTKFL
ncbi:MAG: tRNA (adenosine(37)-N6)-dimethylallyltransferase MiaA [Oscillospiraceae bacterium]|nr:tRNA (adenosine(37)-N6)-dimethylallyltransferase MiaA [Oscillospiraceae bacterium]